MGVYFSQMSVIYFCPEFICCPYYRGVRYSGVSARRELTVFTVAFRCMAPKSARDKHAHFPTVHSCLLHNT